MVIKPLGVRVLLQQEEAEEKTKSGIVLPSNAKERPNFGRVVEVGPGEVKDGKEITVPVKKGDRVIYSKYSGTEVEVERQKYLLVNAGDLLAVLE